MCPTHKLQLALLIIKWKPGDINLASGHEDSWGDVSAGTTARNHNVCRVSPIKSLTGTVKKNREDFRCESFEKEVL